MAEQFQGALGQGNIAVAVAFAAADVEQHAPGIDVAHLQAQTLAQAQSTGVDGSQANVMIKALDFGENIADLRSGENDRQFELGISAD